MLTQLALAATVNHFMKELELSEADIAVRCGLHVSTVRNVTRGENKYSKPATAVKLAQGIGVSPQVFYDKFESFRKP